MKMSEINTKIHVDAMFSTAATTAHFDINAVGMDIQRLQRRIRNSSELLRNTAQQPGCPPHFALKFGEIADQMDAITIDAQVRDIQTAAKSLEMLVKSR